MNITSSDKQKWAFIMMLIGVLVLIVGLFLPYISAVGDLAEYIEKAPDRIEIQKYDLTAGDLKNISVVSVSKIITGVYGEDDGAVANAIVWILGGLAALTALFVILRKPIAALVFDLLSLGIFAFLNSLMKGDFISANKYAWGIGYYAILVAVVAVLAGAIWTLVINALLNRKMIQEQ